MNNIRKSVFALALTAMAGAAGAAVAATPATPASGAKPAATAKVDMNAKRAACEKSWKDQKTHTGKEADFVKACVAKG